MEDKRLIAFRENGFSLYVMEIIENADISLFVFLRINSGEQELNCISYATFVRRGRDHQASQMTRIQWHRDRKWQLDDKIVVKF